MAHLTFFYKVAEGVVPAMPADIDMVLFRGKRQIRPKSFNAYTSANTVTRSAINNHLLNLGFRLTGKCLKPEQFLKAEHLLKHVFPYRDPSFYGPDG